MYHEYKIVCAMINAKQFKYKYLKPSIYQIFTKFLMTAIEKKTKVKLCIMVKRKAAVAKEATS